MEISLIYVLIIVEVLLVLMAATITLTIILLRKKKSAKIDSTTPSDQQTEEELDAIELGNSYIDFLDQAMQRNSKKAAQQKNIEEDIKKSEEEEAAEDATENNEQNNENDTTSPAPSEAQSSLLHAREQFLLMEKTAAEKTEHEIHFWDSIYEGMKVLLEQFSSTEIISSGSGNEEIKTESKEKVFYIETQGKKINGEVNKLKDIIFEQENALSGMLKAMKDAENEHPDESESLKALREQIEIIERQLSESKMCMDVLEMENNRLQEEVNKIDVRHEALFSESDAEDSESTIDLDQMKEMVSKQEGKIQHLIETIESLELEATQAEALKSTISDFARTSKEMISCITILEEENDRLKSSTEQEHADTEPANQVTDSGESDALKASISELEETIIKKDVALAKLQDEFSSMETEYLAMYEAMHGDNS